jgi:hypothetical protein
VIRIDTEDYGHAAEIARHLGGDVTADMVRNWHRRDGLTAYRRGREVWYPLRQAATIEARKRGSGRGRARRLDDHVAVPAMMN